MDRRQFLKALTLSPAVVIAPSALGNALAQATPGDFAPQNRDRISFLLDRITYGKTPDLLQHVQAIGVDAYIEEQLDHTAIDDSHMDPILADFPAMEQSTTELIDTYGGMNGRLVQQIFGSTISRALYSKRQLYEVMVAFWSNHFSVYLGTGPVIYMKVTEDREAIRPHALGKFRDLLLASAKSPAMLIYLDNAFSTGEAPNENYSRELLELHTLGVNGGYTEDDVKEVARILTGWSISRGEGQLGGFRFYARRHDNGTKTVLGTEYPAEGEQEGIRLLENLALHPSTARFIATKLVRRFVSDNPPQDLIDQVAQAYLDHDTDIPAMLRVIFASDAFWQAAPKFKQPFELMTSTLRVVDFQVGRRNAFHRYIIDWLRTLGHLPFNWPAPNGYPDSNAYWMQNLLTRWNLPIGTITPSVVGEPNADALLPLIARSNFDDSLDAAATYIIGRPLTDAERAIVVDYVDAASTADADRLSHAAVLLLASPAFQYR